jgi:uncharacterized cupin superfamily protein
MSQTQHAETMSDAELEDWGPLEPPLAQPLGDPMPTRGLETWSSADEKTSTGIWECGPGPSQWKLEGQGELIYVVRGRMTCTADDGTVTEVGPGDSMTFAPGWSGRWDIHETLRKVYAIFPG